MLTCCKLSREVTKVIKKICIRWWWWWVGRHTSIKQSSLQQGNSLISKKLYHQRKLFSETRLTDETQARESCLWNIDCSEFVK